MSAVLFFIAAIGAIAGAIGVVAVRNPFYSVLSLVVHLISLAVLFLLLVAAVGAVVLARRRRGLEQPDEQFELAIRTPRPAYTGTMAEAAGTRIIETAPEPERVGEVSTREGGW